MEQALKEASAAGSKHRKEQALQGASTARSKHRKDQALQGVSTARSKHGKMNKMTKYKVTGMSCAACQARVERAVAAVPGVGSVAVSLLTNSMGVEGDADPAAVIAAVTAAGYGASLAGSAAGGAGGAGAANAGSAGSAGGASAADEADSLSGKAETRRLLGRFLASLSFLLVLMYVSMGHMMWGFPLPPFLSGNHVGVGLFELLLTVAIMIINKKFFVSGFTALVRRAPNMDTLVALGASAAFLYSTVALFAMTAAVTSGGADAAAPYMNELYFESAGTILTLITLGKTLEARSKGKTTDALRGLYSLAPKTANVIRDGVETTVPASEVRVGDIFVVRPGEAIPTDGVVTDGQTAVDESSLTGESVPVDKAAGDAVFSGTHSRSGFITCRATRVGEDTTLSQIIKMVSDAAATKAPIAKLADRVAAVFVPTVMAIALVTAAVWLAVTPGAGFERVGTALSRGIAVLVISCPCALGLATPVAIMVGSGVGARNGILFKTAASLEAAGRINTVVLDKTGTVTAGEPRVTDVIPAEGVGEEALISLALSVERPSEHPLARAVVAYAEEIGAREARVTEFEALPGNGVKARVSEGGCTTEDGNGGIFDELCATGGVIEGGSVRYIGGRADIPEALGSRADALSAEGKTPLCFTFGGRCLGLIAVADVIKPTSAGAVAELRRMGVRVVMLTGDNERTARAVGDAAGVDEVIAGVLPDGKERVIRELSESGRCAMVGDGINDAPALTAADLGIAIGAGADVAIDAAEVVLMKSDLSDVPAALNLGRATLRNIRENLFWAFIYNVIGIPLAAGVFIPVLNWRLDPMYGALAMSLSSFCVVSNALRLNFTKLHKKNFNNKKEKKEMKISFGKSESTSGATTLKVKGMMCAHCEARVKAALEAVPGVTSAEASAKKGVAVVRGDAAHDALVAAVAAAGYEAE